MVADLVLRCGGSGKGKIGLSILTVLLLLSFIDHDRDRSKLWIPKAFDFSFQIKNFAA
jgi:hypothetical protein